MNEREDLGHRLAEKVMEKKRNAKEKTLGMAKKSSLGDTPNRIRKAMGKTPEMRSPALNVIQQLIKFRSSPSHWRVVSVKISKF